MGTYGDNSFFGIKRGPWEKWFAWYPVKLINGQWKWMTMIYRRCHYHRFDIDILQVWFYGTVFDVIKFE